ncbi:restriction endonuclease subunit S [Umezawaea sp. Da 62-37]|uniref:restriction endonuclease subunit S n=1 Tax=Umezawaea sp. Da 62-37 TaxID=3075927 RepID=UPI0028F70BED|nr:restriction endonuclease subunit S [Umezawaea sp. Da 62-37]WNV82613.1 restriction endonuclease subunit S [Umezawaea sp. Da 62-37]
MISLADIPNNWEHGNIRRFAQMKTGHTPSRSVSAYWEHTEIPWFTLADVWQLRDGRQIYLGETTNTINELGLANSAADLLPSGTVVLSRTASVGFSGIMPKPMATSQDFWNWVCGPQLLPEYLNYQFKAMMAEFRSLNMGSTHQTIYQKDAAALKILVPPLDEQRAIVDYLDRETARIDTLIEEQQRLITLLCERRESAIRSVLLHGLDFDISVRQSSTDFLGQIPSTWRLVPARYLCTITTGGEDSGNASEDGDYPFYVRGRKILRSDNYAFDGEAVMTPGDGQGGTGKVFHYFSGKFQAHQRVYVFTDFQGVDGRYFYYYLANFLRPIALAGSNTVTMESLRRPLLADFPVAIPPMEEQRKIVKYLDQHASKTDTLITEAERFIELSKERRAALITAAVAGQIDVREVA